MEKINPQIIYSVSNEITEEVIKDEALRVVRACFQCGTCTGGCPSGRRTAIRTRQVIRRILLGLDEVLASDDIWLCSTCYTCYERCPRSIPVTDVIIKLRNLASQRGFMKPPHTAVTHILGKTGHGVPLGTQKGGEDNNWSLLRASYGLPNIPPTTLSHPAALKDIQTLMKATDFDKLVGLEFPESAPDIAQKEGPKAEKPKDENAKKIEPQKDKTTSKKASKKKSKKSSKKVSKTASKKASKKKSKKSSKKASKKKSKSRKSRKKKA